MKRMIILASCAIVLFGIGGPAIAYDRPRPTCSHVKEVLE